MKQKLIDFLEEYGKMGSWVEIYNKFPVKGTHLTNKQKSDYVRGVYRRIDTSSKLPKIFIWDIETSPLNAYVWSLWQQNVSPSNGALQSDWFILTWAGKYLFKDKMYSDRLTSEEAINQDDERIVRKLWKMLDEADIVIGHNIQKFDIKKVNTRFLYYGLPLPSPYQVIDTLLQARRVFAITSNKLDYIADFLGLGRKLTTSFALWDGCMKGKEESLKEMDEYCQQDIYVSEEVYLKLRPYMKSHPNLGLYIGDDITACPVCLSKKLTTVGTYKTKVSVYEAKRCKSCQSLSRSHKRDKTKVNIVPS